MKKILFGIFLLIFECSNPVDDEYYTLEEVPIILHGFWLSKELTLDHNPDREYYWCFKSNRQLLVFENLIFSDTIIHGPSGTCSFSYSNDTVRIQTGGKKEPVFEDLFKDQGVELVFLTRLSYDSLIMVYNDSLRKDSLVLIK